MRVYELLEKMNGNYTDYEVYRFIGNNHTIHTDNIKRIYAIWARAELFNDYSYELMDEDEYDRTILANDAEKADFAEWYGNPGAKVLVIMIK